MLLGKQLLHMAYSAFDTLFLSTVGFNLVCMYMYLCFYMYVSVCLSVCLCVCMCAQDCFYYMYYDFWARNQRPALFLGLFYWLLAEMHR